MYREVALISVSEETFSNQIRKTVSVWSLVYISVDMSAFINEFC